MVSGKKRDDRLRVVTLFAADVRPCRIMELTGLSKSTVYRYIRKYKDADEFNDLPRSGRRRKCTPKQEQSIVLLLKKPDATCRSVAGCTGKRGLPLISHPTVARIAKRQGLFFLE
jgi:transposase